MPTEEPTFSPPVYEAESRIRQLRELLSDESQEFQRKNVLFLIHLYETGKLPAPPGETTWILDGKLVDGEPKTISKGSAMWGEAIAIQPMQIAIQSMQPMQPMQTIVGATQMAQSESYGLQGAWRMHEIFVRFRLIAALGGDPNITLDASIANDTGSTIQTIFPTDLANLNYNSNTYLGRGGVISVATANGNVFRERIRIEMQLIRADGTSVSPWFQEWAVITPVQPGLQYRLSGNAMRNHLFFATAPGNMTLFVSEKKNGIVSQLPVV